ncbi:GSCOCG00006297001-RA-CDS [Cotesia congregata]|uniref:Similar to Sobp: Sine oculis-binding protein homolog (Mus musculus) n=1 Tax=Cotesia congregata TaxID=51543 RepID=A0A8J2HFS7_COTCN|nr:GSCOCG00006297001-RA-CDS [Cotesia congregata]CAG5093699.1 Similar to Sobp: Sine oculis-binding protein homolog (Mus musculus) [Cotesia congregata]
MNKQSPFSFSSANTIDKNKTKVNNNNFNDSTVKIKKEPTEDEIKDYAAKAMSELLGWYGYGKVDSRCTRGLNLDHFASRPRGIYQSISRQSPLDNHRPSNYTDDKGSSSSSINLQKRSSQSPRSRMSRSPVNKTCTNSKDNQGASAGTSPKIVENSDSASDTPERSTSCSWCGRTGGTWEPVSACEGTSNPGLTNSNRFCSEACFAAGRRAAFKRARTCDWCRHVRHSVSYVDFHDGESQLQFCSDKCLNQYKMNIFCRETQAHLALHGITSVSPTSPSSGGLITPELWLRDCRSAPPSPDEEALIVDDEPSDWPSSDKPDDESRDLSKKITNDCLQSDNSINNNINISNDNNSNSKQNVQYLDDDEDENVEEAIKESLKEEENRRSQERITASSKSLSSTESSHVSITPGSLLNINNSAAIKACRRSTSSSPESCKESPPTNCSREGTIFIKDVRKLLVRDTVKRHSQPSYRSRRVSGKSMWLPKAHHHNYTHYPMTFPEKGFPNPPSHPIPLQFIRRNYPDNSSPPPQVGSPPSPLHTGASKVLNNPAGLLPPVTVLVPYPIPIPIPLPIPIPIPLFAKFFNSTNSETKKSEKTNPCSNGETTVPQDLSRRSQPMQAKSPCLANSSSEKLINLSDSSTSSSPVLSMTSTGGNFFAVGNKTQARNNSPRPLRKRRRLTSGSDQDIRLKRRNKFVHV